MNYLQRTLVALLLLPALYLILSTGGLSIAALSLVTQILTLQEYHALRPKLLTNLTHTQPHHPKLLTPASQLCTLISVSLAWYYPRTPAAFLPTLFLFAGLVIPYIDLVRPNIVLSTNRTKHDLSALFTATLVDTVVLVTLVAGLTSLIPLSARRNANDEDIGLSLTVFAFLIPWVADTAALIVGSQFGKRKIVPALSPNKTLEGFFAMVPGALLVAILCKFASEVYDFRVLAFYRSYSLPYICRLAIGAAIWGAMGDLLESTMKRLADIKDTGNLFGPHGGVIDRVDSILPVLLALNIVI